MVLHLLDGTSRLGVSRYQGMLSASFLTAATNRSG